MLKNNTRYYHKEIGNVRERRSIWLQLSIVVVTCVAIESQDHYQDSHNLSPKHDQW